MKRILAAAVAAALAIPALAQQSPAKSDTMTLTGADGKSHTYKIVRTSTAPNGGTSYEVKDTVSGEVMTVVDESTKNGAVSPKPADSMAKKAADSTVKPKQTTQVKPSDRAVSPSSMQPTTPLRRFINLFRNDPPASKSMPVQASRIMLPPGENLALYDRDPVIRLIGSLTDDLLPSMREISAETLTRVAGQRPEVVQALVRSAQTDPAPSVRTCCCRCLVTLQVRTPDCAAALHAMEEGDHDSGVRTAAAAALEVLDQ
jgi:hypothetical protein